MVKCHKMFKYIKGSLYAEGVPVGDIAAKAGTPVYVYSRAQVLSNFESFDSAFDGVRHIICYAMKANSSLAVCRDLSRAGAGADIVSGGELFRALNAGFRPGKIVYSGVGKTKDEMRYALQNNILMFNVESVEELRLLNDVAGRLNKKAPISIRVNPDISADTHRHITTGKAENKFGIHKNYIVEAYNTARSLANIEILGLQAHIGSQITSIAPFVTLLKVMLGLFDDISRKGIKLKYLDMGGGLGIDYKGEVPPSPKQMAKAFAPYIKGRDFTLLFEPGRFLAGNAGILVTEVLFRKTSGKKNFIIVDAAMNDLARPALYDAYHEIIPVVRKGGKNVVADVVGPICESGDYFARGRSIESPGSGDYLAIKNAGAYGFSMSSQYNSRLRAAEVLVSGGKWKVVRGRENYRDLVRGEK